MLKRKTFNIWTIQSACRIVCVRILGLGRRAVHIDIVMIREKKMGKRKLVEDRFCHLHFSRDIALVSCCFYSWGQIIKKGRLFTCDSSCLAVSRYNLLSLGGCVLAASSIVHVIISSILQPTADKMQLKYFFRSSACCRSILDSSTWELVLLKLRELIKESVLKRWCTWHHCDGTPAY